MKVHLDTRSEQEIQEDICRYLRHRGIMHSVTDASRSFNHKGQVRKSKVYKDWPDITGIMKGGRAVCIECKTVTGAASQGQLLMLRLLEEQGAIAFIARSASDVHQKLTELGY